MGFQMSKPDLPEDAPPLSPIEYWQESVSAMADFTKRSSEIAMKQFGELQKTPQTSTDDTATAEMLRALSDYNLRRWQNSARFLEGLPSWMRMPQIMVGGALTDWFDQKRRGDATFETQPAHSTDHSPSDLDETAFRPPSILDHPQGSPDDLTQIKGIGPKLSQKLNELGIFHFRQIATWDEPEAAWVEDYLAFKGRVTREDWVTQARKLTSNGASTLH